MLAGKLWNYMIAGMVQNLQGCKVTNYKCTLAVIVIGITNNSKGYRFQFSKPI